MQISLLAKHKRGLAGLVLLLCVIAILFAVLVTAAERKFTRKECLDCHTKFAEKYLSMKNVHAVVKEKKCEDCHIRHGMVPKNVLKKTGNELCYTCHAKEKLGLSKPHVHSV